MMHKNDYEHLIMVELETTVELFSRYGDDGKVLLSVELERILENENPDFPHINPDSRWPTQFSKSTGMSMQLFMYLGPTNRKK